MEVNLFKGLDKSPSVEPTGLQGFWNGVLGVLRYEFNRFLTAPRIATWLALCLFPVLIITIVERILRTNPSATADLWMVTLAQLFVLPIGIITGLSMLLWATPVVHSELEGETWVYSVVRPSAKLMMLVGKYISAVIWTASCTVSTVTIVLPTTNAPNPFYMWAVLSFLCVLAAIATGALCIAIGAFYQRRSMVIAFGYCVVVEGVLAWLPAVINQFTISYRLRSILTNELLSDVPIPPDLDRILSSGEASSVHLGWLFLLTSFFLLAACIKIYKSQFRWQSEL